ncbi:MAG: histone H1 [Hyphomonas sp.]
MAKRARKKAIAKAPTKSKKTTKAIAVKSVRPVKNPVAKKAARKIARRSTADVAKLRKAVIAASKARKSAATIAGELGISKAYVYALKRKA